MLTHLPTLGVSSWHTCRPSLPETIILRMLRLLGHIASAGLVMNNHRNLKIHHMTVEDGEGGWGKLESYC